MDGITTYHLSSEREFTLDVTLRPSTYQIPELSMVSCDPDLGWISFTWDDFNKKSRGNSQKCSSHCQGYILDLLCCRSCLACAAILGFEVDEDEDMMRDAMLGCLG